MSNYILKNSDDLTNNNQSGGNLSGFVYPVVPSTMTTGLPQGPNINTRLVGMPPYMNGPYMSASYNGNIKLGVPVFNPSDSGKNGDIKVIIPPKLNHKDPSIFFAATSEEKKEKKITDESKINMTFKEAEPKQTILTFKPNLPLAPLVNNFNYPVGFGIDQQIVLNPNESVSKIEVTSPDSDDIITIKGDKDKLKPIYDGINNHNKFKLLDKIVPSKRTPEEQKQLDELKKDISGNNVIDLKNLFNDKLIKIEIAKIKNLPVNTITDIKISTSKKFTPLLGLPFLPKYFNYGPTVVFS